VCVSYSSRTGWKSPVGLNTVLTVSAAATKQLYVCVKTSIKVTASMNGSDSYVSCSEPPINVRFFLTTRKASWYIISILSVCLSVCQKITFESFDVGSSFSLIRYIAREYGSSSYIGLYEGQGHRNKKNIENSYSRNVKLQSAITPSL